MKVCVNRRSLWGRLTLGCGLLIAAYELPYFNWRVVVPPVDARPLRIRQDAKGNGRFFAPRSGRRRHRGIDLVADLNSPVRAIRSGTVVQVGEHRGLGRFVELEHPHHMGSLYAHLKDVSVRVGERVRQGAVIATVGKTGNARHPWITPHLHLEVWRAGNPIDPRSLGLAVLDPARPTPSADDTRLAGTPRENVDARGGD